MFRRRFFHAGLSVSLVIVLAFANAAGQSFLTPENPLKGRIVFEQKGCINCHAIKGDGGDIGPDLGETKFYGSFLQLSSIMWNHSPEMLRQMRELDLPYPEFSANELVDLIAYLYYLRYLGEPGDLYRGKILVKEKGCLTCHSVAGKGGTTGPAFDRLAKYVSPLFMAQALWNHGPGMDKELRKKGLRRPQFRKGEIVDLSAYIRSASKGTKREKVYMSPGNPRRGKQVFKEKGCFTCHVADGEGEDIGPNLDELEWNYTVTEIAGLMWNHASAMGEVMQEQKTEWPRLSAKEMADVIAFLYFLKFKDPPGDVAAGKAIFATKGCATCHGTEGTGGEIGPDLLQSRAALSPINMAQVMWNHAPKMEEKITEKAMQWPEFSGQEITDLYAFLKSLVESKDLINQKK